MVTMQRRMEYCFTKGEEQLVDVCVEVVIPTAGPQIGSIPPKIPEGAMTMLSFSKGSWVLRRSAIEKEGTTGVVLSGFS